MEYLVDDCVNAVHFALVMRNKLVFGVYLMLFLRDPCLRIWILNNFIPVTSTTRKKLEVGVLPWLRVQRTENWRQHAGFVCTFSLRCLSLCDVPLMEVYVILDVTNSEGIKPRKASEHLCWPLFEGNVSIEQFLYYGCVSPAENEQWGLLLPW